MHYKQYEPVTFGMEKYPTNIAQPSEHNLKSNFMLKKTN
jgi:hypothetical protein